MGTRILVLDDDSDRLEFFQEIYGAEPTTEVGCAMTIDAACHWLERHYIDLLYLDYNLNNHGCESYINGKYGRIVLTGLDVVRFIVNSLQHDHWPKQVIIHSNDNQGSGIMLQELKSAGIRAAHLPWLRLVTEWDTCRKLIEV